MTLEELSLGLRNAIDAALATFVGTNINKENVDKIQSAANKASLEFYKNIPQEYIDKYDIELVFPKVMVNGNHIYIGNESRLGSPKI